MNSKHRKSAAEAPSSKSPSAAEPLPGCGVPLAALSEDGTHATPKRSECRSQKGALPTTCPLKITEPQAWEFLAAGVDSLDVGLFIDWNEATGKFFQQLERGKAAAQRTPGIPFGDSPDCLILSTGKPPLYSFHLQFPQYHLYFNRAELPKNETPNGYLCLGSEILWRNWLPAALIDPICYVENAGGDVFREQPSRVDLCADFYIPGGLDHNFLSENCCPSDREMRDHKKGRKLETFYAGSTSSPVQCRIYDKGKEIFDKRGLKAWFLDFWEIESVEDVWRVEFQVRREKLRKFGIHTMTALIEGLPALWKHLTEDVLSIRCRDADSNVSRCPMHSWWQDVIDAGKTFGEFKALERSDQTPAPSFGQLIPQMSGCVLSYSVLRRLADLEQALQGCCEDIRQYWLAKDWPESYFTKSVKLGFDPDDVLSSPPAENSDSQAAGDGI